MNHERLEALIQEVQNRPRQLITCQRILVAVDGSPAAHVALQKAIALAQMTSASLTLLMAVDVNASLFAFEQVSVSGYIPYELKAAAYQILAGLMHEIPSTIPAHVRVEMGKPQEVILDVAEEEEIQLIIVGSRGFTRLEEFFLGSVSRYVLEHASCPVLVVKA